jgi:predicted heme/steroid binding protein
MRKFDLESLSQFNGKGGQPCYIAYKNRVFDVSGSKLWDTGSHMKRHSAGRDLTADIQAAPHGPEMLDRYPEVGTLYVKEAAEVTFLPKPLET